MSQRVGYYWNASLDQRKAGMTCPEVPERIHVLKPEAIFREAGIEGRHFGFETRGVEIVEAVHDPEYIAKVRDGFEKGLLYLDSGETRVTKDVFPQALLSASAGCEALDAIGGGRINAAFCAIRPPGHHANRHRGMGFCVFNNAAIAAEYARNRLGIQRILMVDWDVHPGNGSQEIFWEDPGVFNLSFHQTGLFEASGAVALRGRGAGEGFNRNEPIAPSEGPEGYKARFARVVGEVAAQFKPELLIISAGFDAHRGDPASQTRLESEDFGELTTMVLRATAAHTGGRTLSLLEGGYSLGALRSSVVEHYKALCAYYG